MMTQAQRRLYLIEALLKERGEDGLQIPCSEAEQAGLLRALLNVRPPIPASREFLQVQDEYLQELIRGLGVTDIDALEPVRDGIYLWQGDITTLKVDAIVNAANSALLGCFHPLHGCIDNIIHSRSGVQLRLYCRELMDAQGHEEPTGSAKITPAFNLPCKYILHTVGPVIHGPVSERDCALLASCYRSCLKLAAENGCRSIAFCCISTGEFRFPGERAAETAVRTVRDFLRGGRGDMRVVFDVFKDRDFSIYKKLLGV